MKKKVVDEKRRHHRIPTKVRVTATSEDIEDAFMESENMSLGGVLLRTDHLLDEGTELLLRFELPDYRKPIEVKGIVTNVLGENRVGVKFIELDPDTEKAIRYHLLFGERK